MNDAGTVVMKATPKVARVASLFQGQDDPGYRPGLSETIYNSITPYGYAGHGEDMLRALYRVASGDPGEKVRSESLTSNPPKEMHIREDAWKVYLGLPQDNNSFRESEYKPTKSSNKRASYLDFADPTYIFHTSTLAEKPGARGIKQLVEEIQQSGPVVKQDVGAFSSPLFSPKPRVMGNFTFDLGEDEKGPYISYYDKWDLDIIPAKIVKIGKPFEIYGRIYFDPNTYQPLR